MRTQVEIVCDNCDGTGLYSGIGERGGAAIVCYHCKGSGSRTLAYEPFAKRAPVPNHVTRVFERNYGILMNENPKYGGIPVQDWVDGKPFGPESIPRTFVCPMMWDQRKARKQVPSCSLQWGKRFPDCQKYNNCESCWEEFEGEQNEE